MAFALIHYIYLIMAAGLLGCTAVVGKRYSSSRNPLTLVFMAFILLFAISAILYFTKGFFDPMGFEDALLSKMGLGIGLIDTAVFSTFLLYPLSMQYKGQQKEKLILIVIAVLWILVIYASIILATLELQFTGVVDGASNFDMPMQVLGIIILESFFNVGVLLLVVIREKDPTYRNRTLLLLLGYLIFIVAQTLESMGVILVLVPFVILAGIVIMTIGILKE
ncbi:MAG: hypothetical protein GF411_01685 [Candidatus Lokiarchaeota archaeon]|nr:hypothetical protein [Candidatus Lokiarchaeota archaeon]